MDSGVSHLGRLELTLGITMLLSSRLFAWKPFWSRWQLELLKGVFVSSLLVLSFFPLSASKSRAICSTCWTILVIWGEGRKNTATLRQQRQGHKGKPPFSSRLLGTFFFLDSPSTQFLSRHNSQNQTQFFLYYFVLVLGMKLRASHMLRKHSTLSVQKVDS